MRLSRLMPALALAVLVAPAIRAQGTDPSDIDKAVRTKLKSDLRNLVTAQEAYYAGHSTYADAIENLAFRPSTGSHVSLVVTQNNAWAAVASDPAQPARSCVIYINLEEKYRPKTLEEKRNGREGEPVCDGDPKPEG